jgi:hypothetical protein
MKKISFLSAMLLFLVSAFATDTPAYVPHGFHYGYRPVYGHGIHLRPFHSMHRPYFRGDVARLMPAPHKAHSVQISLPGFAEADASIDARAAIEMTKISVPGFLEEDAAMDARAHMEMTEISLPGFAEADAAISEQAVRDMTKICMPDFTEADAEMELVVLSHES